jgi:outer membrane protein OmpA-like peptidoglycan-associated protein
LGTHFELSDSMRLTSTLAVAAVLGLSGSAWAQTVETGQEVRVNPVPPGGGVLLYPGGEYSRSVPSLLYPGERSGPIQLHMPAPRAVRVARRPASVEQPKTPKPAEPKLAAPKPAPPKKVAKVEPAPARPAATSANPFGPDLSNVFRNPSQSAPQNAPQNGPQLASRTAPAGPTNGNESLTKRSVILFAKDAPDPAKTAMGALKFLAGDLNAAMVSPNARVELQAFGGAKGDKGSDARRLSLKRALAIRQVLIDDGMSPDRIDVRAMGGVDDTGPTDRVDVYVKA